MKQKRDPARVAYLVTTSLQQAPNIASHVPRGGVSEHRMVSHVKHARKENMPRKDLLPVSRVRKAGTTASCPLKNPARNVHQARKLLVEDVWYAQLVVLGTTLKVAVLPAAHRVQMVGRSQRQKKIGAADARRERSRPAVPSLVHRVRQDFTKMK